MSDHTPPKPRLIVEQQSDGTLTIEYYINGARSKETLNRGFELYDIVEALAMQRNAMQRQAEAKAERDAHAERQRHRQVWQYVAENHGVGFANKTVGGGPKKYAAEPQPGAVVTSTDLL
jgi:hypothetical protein